MRPTKRASEAKQLTAVIAAGASHVYVTGHAKPMRVIDGAQVIWMQDAREACLRSIRKGDELLVATIGRIGSTRGDIAQVITDVHARGAALVEASTGRRSNDPAVAAMLMLDAVNELSAEHNRWTSRTAREAGAKATRRQGQRMPVAEARRIWTDTTKYQTAGEALAEMDAWSMRTAYLYLGKRHGGDPSRGGRPRQSDK